MDVIIRQCRYREVGRFNSAAAKERVTMANPEGAVWFAALHDSQIMGFCCVVFSGQTARLKSDYVLPGYRRQGIYQQLFRARLDFCALNRAIHRLTAFSTPMSLPQYLKMGFRVCRVKGDISFVEKIL